MFPPDKIAGLSSASFFQNLDSTALNDLLPELDWINLAGGETLFRTGDLGDAMYVVIAGRLRILTTRYNGTEEIIREIAPGESVGELALLTGNPRSATVRAIRDTVLARFSRDAFDKVVQRHPQTFSRLTAQIAGRQSRGSDDRESRRNIRTLAILPVDCRTATQAFIRNLIPVLRPMGPTVHLRSESYRVEDDQITSQLSEMETDHRFLIYEADAEVSAWTKRCMRQADLILVVASADSAPDNARLQLLKNYCASRESIAAIELVLLHPGKFDSSVQVDRWRQTIHPHRHHHVVLEGPRDLEKLARRLTGAAVGLALSGGGARGFAHIGVIRALQETRIPIDVIGGTSMGAVIAAQYALGWDWQTMARVNCDEWPRCEPQKNYTLPLIALNSGRRMDQMLQRIFGVAAIQNLRSDFFCVATNLTRAKAHIYQEGLLWKAVRASISMPGIGPPAIENGEIFVDGGLVNNLPVDVMKKLCPGVILAVDVSEQLEFKSMLKESYSVSGWRVLWQSLNPFSQRPDIPNILNILYRTTSVGSIRLLETARAEADFCFSPPVQQFNVFDWDKADKIIDIGYNYTLQEIAKSGNNFSSGFAPKAAR
ncbi:MAG: cyclic nucleotide-binding and patatin-like phospholipase domain-containing protein [Candidatus Binatia bacterium]